MSDLLVEMGTHRGARKLVKSLGLPIPMPEKLRRSTHALEERPLHDRAVVVQAQGELTEAIAQTLGAAGANPYVEGDMGPFQVHGEAWGRLPKDIDEAPKKVHALVLDATGISAPTELRALYDFFHGRIRSLDRCGRLIVLARPHQRMLNVQRAAAQRALEGFVKAAGREVGRNGSTANLIIVQEGAEDRLEGVLRFALSDRSAYVSGQPLRVSKTVRLAKELPVTRSLAGKTALVTGAARGIGAAIARALAREGAHVLLLDRPADSAPLAKIADEVGGTPVLVDVTSPDAVDVITAAAEAHGGLDVVIHNAGVTRDKTLGRMKPELWDMTIGINLAAVADLCENLPLNSGGRIVLLSSIAGISGNLGQTNYSCSKAGVIGLAEALGLKLARRGIAVNAIAPGFIETRLTKAIPVATREVARRLCNLAQGGLPADIAEVATFLSSPQGGALCGQVIRVCGGNYVGA
ncbi:MAG: 3-oxoacyl-ACP reductase [Rhodobacterales bacterium]|nr:3-oxoacyl-ACP reductase [Rhodobacterales bacterium]